MKTGSWVRRRGAVRWLGFGLAALIVLLAAACGSDDTSSGTDTSATAAKPSVVRIGTFSRAVDYAPFYVAKASGAFEAAADGAKVEYVEFDSAPAITEALGSGKVDVVFMAEPPAIIAASAGIDIKIPVNGVSLVQEILVAPDSGIDQVSQLKGKKISVLFGSSSHYGVLKLLSDAGVDPSDVQLIDQAPPDAMAAFKSGAVDAWAVWPPFVEQEEIAGTGKVLPRGDAAINSIMVVRGGFANDYPEVYRGLVDAVLDAKKSIVADGAGAQATVAKQVGVPLPVVERAWPRHDFAATLNEEVIADIQAKADFLVEQKYIQKPVDVSTLIQPAD